VTLIKKKRTSKYPANTIMMKYYTRKNIPKKTWKNLKEEKLSRNLRDFLL
jgi:hypothetical protein